MSVNTLEKPNKNDLFETVKQARALAVMAVPTIASQLIVLVYNLADTWFIGRTNNPYMIGASSMVLTLYLAAVALANVFGVGGGSLMARLMGEKRTDEARRVASYSIAVAALSALVFSLLVLIFMNPLLRPALYDARLSHRELHERRGQGKGVLPPGTDPPPGADHTAAVDHEPPLWTERTDMGPAHRGCGQRRDRACVLRECGEGDGWEMTGILPHEGGAHKGQITKFPPERVLKRVLWADCD